MHLDTAARTLRRHGLVAGLVVLLALATGWGVTQLLPPTYTSTVRALYSVTGLGSVADSVQAGSLAAARVEQDAELVTAPVVVQPVIDQLGLDTTAEDLAEQVTATASAAFLDVEVAADDPQVAAQVAQALVAQLALRAADESIAADPTDPESPVATLAVAEVAPAVVPERPSSPNLLLNLAVAFVAGLFLAGLLVTLRMRSDTRLDDAEDLADVTPAPVLAHVHAPARDHGGGRGVAAALTGGGPDVAALRTALLSRAAGRPATSVALLACGPEPVLLVAAALARSCAGAGRDTVLVEGELGRPRLAAEADVRGPGLADALAGSVSVTETARPGPVPSLRVVTAGTVEGDPGDLVASRQAEKALEDVRRLGELVVVAAGRASAGVDAAVLAAACDEVVVLVGRGRARREDLQAALHALDVAGASVGGLVWVS
ncbi:hypothetical protein [Cellulomonas telluris]|uniref:hypothetical protein n=1 Tax=Cellulomonas telluris TaxID=2306636 RepID=UPI0010A76003|nr:hypothetical protein [Cellulomonas telluris]